MFSAFLLLIAGYFWGSLTKRISTRNQLDRMPKWPLIALAVAWTVGALLAPGPPMALVAFLLGLAVGFFITV